MSSTAVRLSFVLVLSSTFVLLGIITADYLGNVGAVRNRQVYFK